MFTPYEKLSKKEQRKINQSKRGSWCGVNPVTKIIPDKKKYNRRGKYPSDYSES